MTVRLVGIGGFPGSGKSLLMRHMLTRFGPAGEAFYSRDNRGWHAINPIIGTIYPEHAVLALGRYPDTGWVSGTDLLGKNICESFNLHAFFTKWLTEYAHLRIIYEGDRLFNRPFIDMAWRYGCDVRLFLLTADAAILAQRYAARPAAFGKQRERVKKTAIAKQSPIWIKQISSKYQHLQAEFPVTVLTHNTPDDLACAVELVWSDLMN